MLAVHVLPRDLARGAQVFARTLCDRLDGAYGDHRTLTLFKGPCGVLHPDHQLDIRPGRLRRAGFDPRVAYQLRRALAALAPDVVVAHGGEPLKYCVPATPRHCRLVYYKIGSVKAAGRAAQAGATGTRGTRQPAHARLHRRLARAADHVVAISDDLATEARALFHLGPDEITVIPNGRDPDAYREADHSTRDVQLVYVGHMEAPKRPLWFVEVVRRVVEEQPGIEVRAVMAGDGPLLDEVRRAVVHGELPIQVLGRRDDVPELLAASHVLVSPSEREGMPGVVIEAGLSGLPVVATDVAGARTLVDPGVTGYIVPTDDLGQLAERTAELVADPARRRAMGDAARRRCHDRFTLDAVVDAWATLLVR